MKTNFSIFQRIGPQVFISICLSAHLACAQDSKSPEAIKQLSKAGAAEQQGDVPGALHELQEAIRLDPNFAEAYSRRGQVYAGLGKKGRAFMDVRKALELDPNNSDYRRQMSELLQEPVDLRTWNVQGYEENGQWEVASDGKSVLQKINRSPTFFVSPDNYVDTTVQGKFRVETGFDDDYIGFVIGFQSPISQRGDKPAQFDFLLFDWKQIGQRDAQEGFSLARVKGVFDFAGGPDGGHDVPGFWNHASSEQFTLLATDFGEGKGWKENTSHEFELVYAKDRVKISIDGKLIFDVTGDFPAGRFGFYNYSQEAVRYTGFTKTTIEPFSFLNVTSDKVLPIALTPAVELILDSSGSMKELVEGRSKNEVARDVMNEVLSELPADIAVGLRLYGHWGQWVARKNDAKAAAVVVTDPRLNTDSDLVVPIGPLSDEQRKKLSTWINWAEPRGKTPMIYSLLEARNDFPSEYGGGKTVVLVSDGLDTCGGKLEDVAAAYRDSGLAAVVHVVGFDIEGTDAQKQLQEIAKLGGGRYFSASNSNDLATALREAVPKLDVVVYDETGKSMITRGPLNGDPFELKPGKYVVQVSGLKSDPIPIELTIEQLLELKLDEQGQLAPLVPEKQ